jgi:cell division protein FtsW
MRTEDSFFTDWWYQIDRRLLWCVLGLAVVGMWAMVSAGSVAAERIHQPWHFFLIKALPFYAIGLITLIATSAMPKKLILLLAGLNAAACAVLLFATVGGPLSVCHNGSCRWVNFGMGEIMPADALKPGFVVITAWFLAKMKSAFGDNIFINKDAWRLKILSWWSYMAVFGIVFIVILTRPDLGTSVLYLLVLSAMLFLAGLPLWLIPVLGGILALVGTFAFFTMGHVHDRIMQLMTGKGDDYQIRQSIQSIQNGGLIGRGEDAFVKQSLPDAHTDFVFSAMAEDRGAIFAVILLCVFLYMMKRLASNAANAKDPFVYYAVGGTLALFGAQVCINIMSALHLFAPKGMTLPFISYGGTSFVAFCLLFGMVIALARHDKWRRV